MMGPPDQPPVMVDQVNTLSILAETLAAQPQVAVDTESNSLFAYQEQVCLIQFSIPADDFMVDPIALPDLSVLGKVFSDPKIEKIFHAAEYDLICLKRDFEFQINNVFDTMQAARILGRTNVGLAAMLESEFGIAIEKKYQRANWGERPLSNAMLAYARLDSRYLIDLRNRLQAELIEKGLLDLAREDFQRVTQVDPGATELEPPVYWRINGSQKLNPQQNGVLQSLLEYRDHQARRVDLPPFKVLSHQTLLQIAEELPLTWEALADIPTLAARQRERHANGLLAAIKHGLLNPPLPKPANHRPPEAVLQRMEALRDWRKETARKLEVESDIVLPRDILEDIASKAPATHNELQKIMQDVPWRFEHYGSQILAVIDQKESM